MSHERLTSSGPSIWERDEARRRKDLQETKARSVQSTCPSPQESNTPEKGLVNQGSPPPFHCMPWVSPLRAGHWTLAVGY